MELHLILSLISYQLCFYECPWETVNKAGKRDTDNDPSRKKQAVIAINKQLEICHHGNTQRNSR